MEITMMLKNDKKIICTGKTFDFYQKRFPKLDIVKELKMISYFFNYFNEARAENKLELNKKILLYLQKSNIGKGITEEKIKNIIGEDYIPMNTYEEFCNLLNQN